MNLKAIAIADDLSTCTYTSSPPSHGSKLGSYRSKVRINLLVISLTHKRAPRTGAHMQLFHIYPHHPLQSCHLL